MAIPLKIVLSRSDQTLASHHSLHGLNLYFDRNFQISNISNLLPILRYPNTKSAKSVEIRRS